MHSPSINYSWAHWSIAAVIVILVTSATLSSAAPDVSCAEKATKTRADELRTAYNDYAREMIRITDTLTKDELDALKIIGNSGQSESLRAQTRHANDVNEAHRTLNYKLQQAWNNYRVKYASCGYASSVVPQYQYSYDTVYPQQNPYWYGYLGYDQAYQFPYQQPWYRWNPFYSQNYCPQVVMTTLPLGCGYECKNDERGCQICEVSCRNVDTRNRPNCNCSSFYSPVCGRDGRTYTNSCYALCADVGIVSGGTCLR